ncbi:MAG TPA: V-type ATP synthase subunit D [Anaerolineae bacterium]|nr:V-type ATP synthase subunit D [Anaerolineae bacterium]
MAKKVGTVSWISGPVVKARGMLGFTMMESVEVGEEAPPLQYGLGDTTAALDEAVRSFHDLLPSICQVAEMLTAVWRLTREIKKAQRRVNALENIFIPRYQATLKFIEDTLEEKERDDLFRMKLIKGKLAPLG